MRRLDRKDSQLFLHCELWLELNDPFFRDKILAHLTPRPKYPSPLEQVCIDHFITLPEDRFYSQKFKDTVAEIAANRVVLS